MNGKLMNSDNSLSPNYSNKACVPWWWIIGHDWTRTMITLVACNINKSLWCRPHGLGWVHIANYILKLRQIMTNNVKFANICHNSLWSTKSFNVNHFLWHYWLLFAYNWHIIIKLLRNHAEFCCNRFCDFFQYYSRIIPDFLFIDILI